MVSFYINPSSWCMWCHALWPIIIRVGQPIFPCLFKSKGYCSHCYFYTIVSWQCEYCLAYVIALGGIRSTAFTTLADNAFCRHCDEPESQRERLTLCHHWRILTWGFARLHGHHQNQIWDDEGATVCDCQKTLDVRGMRPPSNPSKEEGSYGSYVSTIGKTCEVITVGSD